MHAAALTIHIGAGCLAILSGFAAIAVAKGGRQHRLFGTIFFFSMLTMTGMAALMAALIPERPNIAAAALACYLVVSGWTTARRRTNGIGLRDYVGLAAILGIVAMDLAFAGLAAASPNGRLDGAPPAAYYIFAGLAAFVAMLDLSMILRGGVAGPRRLARHVWRMCTALFIASGSFFIGQQKVMPAFMHGSPILLALGIAPLPLMVFWLIRVWRGAGTRARTPLLEAEAR